MAKSRYITMRVEEHIHEYLKEMAERDHRTVTNLISLILIRAVEQDKEERNGEDL